MNLITETISFEKHWSYEVSHAKTTIKTYANKKLNVLEKLSLTV